MWVPAGARGSASSETYRRCRGDLEAAERALHGSAAKSVVDLDGHSLRGLRDALGEAMHKFDPDRSRLPIPDRTFGGVAGRTLRESVGDWSMLAGVKAPEDAPNVLIVLIDDAGFGGPDTFGGAISTPTMTRLADNGLTYNRFHVTAVCSPTRAALLTGRNHHRCGFGSIAEYPGPYPGYSATLPRSIAPLPRVLRDNGYVTGGFGKWHLTPDNVQGAAGPFDRWPQGWGFDHWWGFLSGAAGQYDPIITQDNGVIGVPGHGADKPYYFPDDLTDKAVEAIRSGRYDLLVLNYANPDMVGHTGSLAAAVRAALGLEQGPDPWHGLESLLEEDLALLVMDSLEVPWERAERAVEAVLARVAAIPSVLLLASMRSGNPPVSPSWKLRFELAPLPAPYDRQLLLDIAPDLDPGSAALPQALRALDCVPLAIELFAAQAAGQGSLDYAWSQWRSERVGMLAREGVPDRLSSLAVSLEASLGSPRMNDLARRLYPVLGRLPAGWAREHAGQLLPDALDDAPVRLLRTRLVRFEDGRLRMLGPVREHALAQNLAPADEAHLTALLTGLADALPLQHEGAADPARAAQAQGEIANIEAALGTIRAAAPEDAHQLGWRWMQVGDTRLTECVLAAALHAYQAAEQQFSGCVQAEGEQPRWRRSLAAAQLRIGDVRRDLGELGIARGAYSAAIALLETLVAGEPEQAQWQRDLAIARSELADTLLAMGDVAGAASAQGAALDMLKAQAAASPEDAAAQRDLLVGWAKLGQLKLRQRDAAAALAAHGNAAAIASAQLLRSPESAAWQRDLSVARLGIGDAQRALGELPPALAAYGEALAARERLAAAAPAEPYRQYDLAVACERVALTREAIGDAPGALAAWRRALSISERVAAAHPDSIDLQLAPVTHLHGIARLLARGEPAGHAEAVAMLQRAIDILRAAAAADRLDAERTGWIAAIETRLADLTAGARLVTPPPASATSTG